MNMTLLVLLCLSWVQIGVLTYYLFETREAVKLYLIPPEE